MDKFNNKDEADEIRHNS